ncbi:hypothetical protein [Roseburia inulinivorans]|uniref:hypothetical protein n=1 Tax=Roseburia inulinivorans TaxID=360807 RepID=UPI00248FCABE|nr:hypothetical protein [Roseburia inulinivorans]
MTKIKNTKKGMAKKTLSMSLVVAMLATSNVPVWAAEFSDGTDVAVTSEAEAPVVEDTTTDEFTSEATPEVATEETVAPATAAEVNTNGFVSTMKVKMNADGWGNKVTVTGTLKDENGAPVTTTDNADANKKVQVSYTWLSNGLEANANNSSAILPQSTLVDTITYTPNREDFNKDLSLMVTVKRGNTVVYQETVAGGVVGAKDISDEFKASLTGVTDQIYNGKEQKVVPTNSYTVKTDFGTITEKHITWNYKEASKDFTNVTGKNITVIGTLEGTYDATTEAYGYKATTAFATYQIKPLAITASNLEAAMKTTSVQFTGTNQKFGKSDVTFLVKANDSTKIDISAAIRNNASFTGATNTGEYTLNVDTDALNPQSDVLKNFTVPVSAVSTTTSNKYSIVKRDLSKCSVVSDIELNIDDVKNLTADQLVAEITAKAGKVTFKGEDGRTFTLNDIRYNVNIAAEQVLVDAINAGTKGTVERAVNVSFKADTKDITGSIFVPVRLTVNNLANVDINVNGSWLSTNPNVPTDLGFKYIAKAYDLEAYAKDSKYGITSFIVNGLKSGEYKITYSDNVNAGTAKVTVTGLLSYEGSVKNFYFKINKNDIVQDSVSMKETVTVNSANNADASLYKDALGLAIKQELYSGAGKTTLELDKDYTVKYYYTKSAVNTKDDAEKADGDNVPDNYVTAVVTVKDGNYNEVVFVKSAKITRKKISNVTIDVEKSSYTYTGKQIVPEVVVKDGSSVLEKGVDYSVLVKDNINVGTATVTIKALAGSDYEVDSTATATFEITPAKAEDVKVTLTKSEYKYNKGKQIKPEISAITLNGENVTEQFDVKHLTYGDNNQAGKEMGTITVSPKSGNKNFSGTKTHKFDIKGIELGGTLKVFGSNKKEIKTNKIPAEWLWGVTKETNFISWDSYHFYYNGAECKFANTAFLPSIVAAKEGTDYEIKYIDNVDAGYGYVAVIAKGNYESNADIDVIDGKKDGKYNVIASVRDGKLGNQSNIVAIIGFQIKASVFTAKNINVTNGVYASGLPVQPKVTVSVAGKTLVEGKDYKLNIRPQDTDKTFTYPASIINATEGKIFYVDVIPMGGYTYDDIDGSNTFAWGIDKFDFAAADITSVGDTITVKNGNMTVDPSDYTVTKDETAGTVTIAAKEGSKNYTGSQTVKVNNVQIQTPVISGVNVVGNKATVILSGESDGASGYDYVISKANDYKTDRVDVTKNQIKTTGDFKYVQQGTYYAYCHAWTRDTNGKKVFSGWSNIYPFSVTAITPDAPVITNVKVSGSTIKVTYKEATNATGYDVVLGTGSKKENGETRPYQYGDHKILNLKEGTVTATFKNVPKGTWTVGMHAFNRTSENGKKVFSKWSNLKKATVK